MEYHIQSICEQRIPPTEDAEFVLSVCYRNSQSGAEVQFGKVWMKTAGSWYVRQVMQGGSSELRAREVVIIRGRGEGKVAISCDQTIENRPGSEAYDLFLL